MRSTRSNRVLRGVLTTAPELGPEGESQSRTGGGGGHCRQREQHKDTAGLQRPPLQHRNSVVGLREPIERRQSSGPEGRQKGGSKPGPDLGGRANLTKRVHDRNNTDLAVQCAKRTVQSSALAPCVQVLAPPALVRPSAPQAQCVHLYNGLIISGEDRERAKPSGCHHIGSW